MDEIKSCNKIKQFKNVEAHHEALHFVLKQKKAAPVKGAAFF